MKIKSCEIGNFGKLSNKTINLDDRLTVIRGKNESGKSTLSSFIKYILYGYTGKGRDERANDKLRYTPWSGMKSGGALVLEDSKGERYRAERSSAKREEVKVLNSAGSLCFEGYDPGEALFGVDAVTFTKSAFVGQNDIEAGGMKDLGGSLEKLIMESDENGDFDRADKNLTAERNRLYNKMRSTGKIFELADRLEKLRSKKEKDAENHKTLLTSKFSAGETEKKITENKRRLEILYGEAENIAAYEAEEKLIKIRSAEEKAKAAGQEYNAVTERITRDGFVPDTKYLDSLTKCHADFSAAYPSFERAESELSNTELKYRLEAEKLYAGNKLPKSTEQDTSEIHSLYKTAQDAEKKYKSLKTAAIVLTCLVLTLPIAIVVFVLAGKQKSKLYALLSEKGFESMKQLEKLDSECDGIVQKLSEIRDEISAKRRELEEKKIEYSVCRELLCEKLERIGWQTANKSDDGILAEVKNELLPKLCEDVGAAEDAKLKLDNAENALNSLMAVSNINELLLLSEKKRSTPPERSREEVERAVKYDEGANVLLEKRLSELKCEIAGLEALNSDPVLIESEIAEVEKELEEAKLNLDAIELASELVSRARNDIRSGVLPKISEKAGKLFSDFTGGKYRALNFDKDFGVSVLCSGDAETRRIGALSSGAIDAAYIALRISLAEALCREKPTFIFDDSFVRTDDERLKNILDVLVSLSQEYQVVILTCHDREEKYLGGRCKVVVIDEE